MWFRSSNSGGAVTVISISLIQQYQSRCDGLTHLSNKPLNRHCKLSLKSQMQNNEDACTTRRSVMAGIFAMAFPASVVLTTSPADTALAFDNKISNKYDDRPKRRGPQPKDLGVGSRTTVDGYDDYVGLKGCGPAPNCFSSSITMEDDLDHLIPPWVSKSSSIESSFRELKEAVDAYQPGQNGVDGGGFKIQTFDPIKGYMYIQFEALKNGYIDDVEFAVVSSPQEGKNLAVQVRSSSRIGYLDYGVNAKRLNFLADTMRSKGWDSPGVDLKTHQFYAAENQR